MVKYMHLCQLDGKIYEGVVYNIILKNKNKEFKCDCCTLCYGELNIKYELGKEKNIFIIPENVVLKVYKISSSIFEYKPEKDKPESKVLIDILKNAKKKYKDLLQ
jgi:hypothetical protein